jgi:23S rRNA (cytidine2498-2'-O)-methyltransferase
VQSTGRPTHLFICRTGYERVLAQEWSQFQPKNRDPRRVAPEAAVGSGWMGVAGALPLPEAPLVFERQRLPRARWCAGDEFAALTAALAELEGAAVAHGSAWTLHCFAPDPDSADSRSGEAQSLERQLLARLDKEHPAALRGHRPALPPAPSGASLVWQVCRLEGGAWSSVAPAADLSDPYPGGVHRMPPDPLAPSRSYLKIEEALDVMAAAQLCAAPRPNETVVDLGAAPGGWTWAFAKRGCRVFAVDNGPLKLSGTGEMGGEVLHLREDGLRFRPERPVDWLLSDMLIAPGVALGLLRRWIAGGWARRMIVNLKLPQADPLVALAPIQEFLRGVPGLRWRLRQLYHDRREVTLMGELTGIPRSLGGESHARGRPARRPAANGAAARRAPRTGRRGRR